MVFGLFCYWFSLLCYYGPMVLFFVLFVCFVVGLFVVLFFPFYRPVSLRVLHKWLFCLAGLFSGCVCLVMVIICCLYIHKVIVGCSV